jgi:putative ABC transport system permease protein
MNWLGWFQKRRWEERMDAEFRFHMENQIGEYVNQGLSRGEAESRARREFGPVELAKDECRDQKPVESILQNCIRDLRYAARRLVREPGASLAIILTLALGSGAVTAIFSIVNPLLVKQLPYPKPERLVGFGTLNQGAAYQRASFVPPYLVDLREQSRIFEQIVGISPSWEMALTGLGDPAIVRAVYVSRGVFEMFGVRPVAGREFHEDEHKAGAEPVAVATEGFWRRHFGADAQLANQTLTLDGHAYRLVGLIPSTVRLPDVDDEIWLPFSQNPYFTSRIAPVMFPVGRLRPDVTLAQAQDEVNRIAKNLAPNYPPENLVKRLVVVSLREQLASQVKTTLLVLAGAVGFLLLIACANVANLLLSRGAARSREIAVRIALGANRRRVVQQLLTESILLALLGGALGLFLAFLGERTLLALAPENLPRRDAVQLDIYVYAFALLLSFATGLLFGIAPAIHASKLSLSDPLNQGGRGAIGGSGQRLRGFLVMSEVALAVVLLVGAGLLIRSFERLSRVDPGFRTTNLSAMEIFLPDIRYRSQPPRIAFYEQLVQALKTLPGVEAVAAVNRLPLGGSNVTVGVTIEGSPQPESHASIDRRVVTPEYFSTLGIPVMRGRGFTPSDRAEAPAVAVVNQTMARRFWPNEDPVGRRARLRIGSNGLVVAVVGVAGDIRHHGLDTEPRPELYVPFAQAGVQGMTIVMRTAAPSDRLMSAARQQVWALDGQIPAPSVRTLDDVLAASIARPRFRTLLLGLFAGLALMLAAVGIYSVIAYSISLRTNEIGLRMALGAEKTDIFGMVLRQAFVLTLAGIVVGVVGAVFLTRLLSNLLFEVQSGDPLTFAVAIVGLVGVALVAGYLPAWRATRVDPTVALRIT